MLASPYDGLFKSPKTNALVIGLIEKIPSVLDETASKSVRKDEESNR